MDFKKSGAKAQSPDAPKKTFADIAGCDEAKRELMELVSYIKGLSFFEMVNAKMPKGVLLAGRPGTGKTLLAKALAGEAGVPFFSISASEFVEMFVGVGAGRVRDLMDKARKSAPCVVFIDEIDAVGRHRGSGLGGGHDEREQTLNQLLVEMDGFNDRSGVIVIAATNRPDILDPALLRPGRFDKHIFIPLPDLAGRKAILEIHTRGKPLAADVDLEKIARGTYGFSGADLENLCNEAALLTIRKLAEKAKEFKADLAAGNGDAPAERKIVIPHRAFVEAWEKILAGGDERRIITSQREKLRIAHHEAGHAVVAYIRHLLEPEDSNPLYKVSIIARGQALGLTYQLPQEERRLLTTTQAYNMIRVLFGGRAAEELEFKDVSSGAANDLQKATELVKKMVLEWGMSDLTPIYIGEPEHVNIGMEITKKKYSGLSEDEINKKIKEIFEGTLNETRFIVTKNRRALEELTGALLERETLDAEECEEIFRNTIPEENRQRETYCKK